LIVFGAQTHPKIVRYTHTFGTFVRTSGDGGDFHSKPIDEVTISWFPESMILHPLKMRPEPGVNVDLFRTLDKVLDDGGCISMWGPFEICPELYAKALQRLSHLETDRPAYNVVDRNRRPVVLDCIHALSGVDPDPGRMHTRLAYGDIASYFVLIHFGRYLIQPEVTHDWVADRLGLGTYRIRQRAYGEEPLSLLPILSPYYTPRRSPSIRSRFWPD
jgi:hypothetical protein